MVKLLDDTGLSVLLYMRRLLDLLWVDGMMLQVERKDVSVCFLP
jgi:hypothetical protein